MQRQPSERDVPRPLGAPMPPAIAASMQRFALGYGSRATIPARRVDGRGARPRDRSRRRLLAATAVLCARVRSCPSHTKCRECR